ncbi:MAG: phytoene/squalene synthase family protein [Verrucomicrobiota bacterium]
MNSDLNQLLQATSRSFYLTLRVRPARVRPHIGLAYLLARTADTIADTGIVPPAQRLDALQKFRERLPGQNSAPLDFGELVRQQGLPAERALLEKTEASLAQLRLLSPADLKLVREVLTTITSGQELDLRRFASACAEKIIALQNAAELDDYTYRVAGCVGEFWTKICRAHLFPKAKLDEARWLADGIRFGKGLQLVNILRDLPQDLRAGRCYLPADELAAAGLAPADLLLPANEPRFRPLYQHHLDLAEAHLAAGWRYTNALPSGQVRVRLACAWPVLIGAKTVARLRTGNVLDPQQRIKISRDEVRGILLRSLMRYPFSGAWQNQFPAGRKQG